MNFERAEGTRGATPKEKEKSVCMGSWIGRQASRIDSRVAIGDWFLAVDSDRAASSAGSAVGF